MGPCRRNITERHELLQIANKVRLRVWGHVRFGVRDEGYLGEASKTTTFTNFRKVIESDMSVL